MNLALNISKTQYVSVVSMGKKYWELLKCNIFGQKGFPPTIISQMHKIQVASFVPKIEANVTLTAEKLHTSMKQFPF